jgi:hypothetical protein
MTEPEGDRAPERARFRSASILSNQKLFEAHTTKDDGMGIGLQSVARYRKPHGRLWATRMTARLHFRFPFQRTTNQY